MNYEYWETLFYMVFPLCKDSDLDWWGFSSHETDEIYEEKSFPQATEIPRAIPLYHFDCDYHCDFDNNNTQINMVTI
tara:strand:+ start:7846 stop:8076 length:231 start_codon:yes stop_codon:yes gene_type:complete